jgi:hypothetical protein
MTKSQLFRLQTSSWLKKRQQKAIASLIIPEMVNAIPLGTVSLQTGGYFGGVGLYTCAISFEFASAGGRPSGVCVFDTVFGTESNLSQSNL